MLEVLDGRYRIIEQIGEGGMATVFKAEDTVLQRAVAVKILRPHYASDPEFVARFQQEARSAASLAHQNIVGIFDVGQQDGIDYIVMELIEGRNLKEVILSEGSFPPGRAVGIASQVCSALAFAHSKRIVHRDVKPQNIMITGDDRIKLTDFGIARALVPGATSQTGQVLGSVHYFSPEQAKGESVTEPADIYSTGIVLFEMLTGRMPFDGESVIGIALKHIQEPPPSPHSLNEKIPPGLEAMVLKAMAKNPADRFPSAREFEKALQGYSQLSEQQTGSFKPIKETTAPVAKQEPAKNQANVNSPPIAQVSNRQVAANRTAAPPPAVAARPVKKSSGFDWLLLFLSGATLFFLLGLLVVGAAVYRTYVIGTPTPAARSLAKVLVPGIERFDAQIARNAVESQRLRFEITGEEYSREVAVGKIIRQEPRAGDLVAEGDIVYALLSKGPEMLRVPTVMQLKYVEAASKLKADGFDVDMKEEWNNKVGKGLVFKQDPEAGKESKPGTKIILTVSKGEEVGVVPNVIGMSEDKAKELIEKAKLRNYPWVNYQGHGQLPDDVLKKVAVGTVLSVDPMPGKELPLGAEVKMAVRKD